MAAWGVLEHLGQLLPLGLGGGLALFGLGHAAVYGPGPQADLRHGWTGRR